MRKLFCLGLGACLLFLLTGCAGARRFTVTFMSGERVVKVMEARAGEEIDLRYAAEAPEKASDEKYDYTFAGWSLTEGGAPVQRYTVTESVTFYAGYHAEAREPASPVKKYALFLHVLGETEEFRLAEGEAVPLGVPRLPAYVSFEAWCSDEALTQKAELNAMPARETHVYAKCRLTLPRGSLTAEGPMVYGGENRVRVTGLAEAEGLSYRIRWQGAPAPDGFAQLTGAGEYALSAEIEATYLGLSDAHTLTGTFTVKKRALQAAVSAEPAYRYGDEISPVLHCEGLVRGDSANSLGARFVYRKNGVPVAPGRLSVGEYLVTAEFSAAENYELSEVKPASFTVTKRPVSAELSVADVSYGNTPAPEIVWSGLPEGESLPLGEDAFVYFKGGEPFSGRFTPGNYTLAVDAARLLFENYAPEEINSCSFRVTKASLRGTVTLERETVVYGDRAEPAIVVEGFVYGESAQLSPVFRYRGEKRGDPLPVGEYEVTAELDVPENYTLGELLPARLTVEKRPLTPKIVVGSEYTYGETPVPALSFSGFAAGEGEEQIVRTGDALLYLREGEPHAADRFPAGNYTVEADLAGLQAENYSFSAGNRASFIVRKAQGALDVSGIAREYVYTGGMQTVSGGATANNREDGVISYSDNTFTTVAEGNALEITVTLSEGENYTGATEKVGGFTVQKQRLQTLPVQPPAIPEQTNEIGKTLGDVSIPDPRFSWKRTGETLTLGRHSYAAVYDGDPDNVFPFETALAFSTRKETFALSVKGGEADYAKDASAAGLTLASYELTDEEGALCGEEVRQYLKFTPAAAADLSVGGTYPVRWTFVLTENDYFKVRFGGETTEETLREFAGSVPFKWKSVEVDGKLYTAEDALNALAAGQTATVKYDTAFSSEDVYSGAQFHTVKSGATLLVPFGEEDRGETQQLQANRSYLAVSPEGYVSLSLPKGELTVAGKLIVNADRVSNSNQTGNVRGSAYATFGIGAGAQVTVENGGVFESMGFTYGEGCVRAESGATVYEPFAMPGWKGGTVSTGIRNTVFPVNQFTASSLVAKTEFSAGATYSLRVAVTASNSAQNGLITFVGDQNALMRLRSGKITKYTDESGGRVHLDLAGDVVLGNISITVSAGSASTAGLQVPLPGHFSLALKEGSLTVPESVGLKLLPGARFSSEAGTVFTVEKGGMFYAYGQNNHSMSGVTEFRDGNLTGLKEYPNGYVAGCYRKPPTLDYSATSAATVTIGGAFRAEEGAKVGVRFSGEDGASLSFAENATYENVVREDLSTTNDIGGFLGSLMGTGGKFFETTFTLGGMTAGNYTHKSGDWSKEE